MTRAGRPLRLVANAARKGILATCLFGVTGSVVAQGDDARLAMVTASRVAVISDGDYLASTYSDGVLPRHGIHRDQLTLFTIGKGRVRRASIAVSNSVTAAPEILAAAPGGRTFYVVDRLARATPNARLAGDLRAGRTLTAVRADANGALSILAVRKVPPFSEALAISPDGKWLALVANEQGAGSITIVPLGKDGAPRAPQTYLARPLGLGGEGALLTNVQWHPQGNALAVNDSGRSRIGFLRFEPARGLSAWGAAVASGRDPFVGRFAPDGRHYLVSEWGRDLAARQLVDRIPAMPGQLGIIRVDPSGRHERIGGVDTGSSPEGLAISPDGRLVATANMRGTLFPPGSPRHTRQGSITLIAFDPATGRARKLSETRFDAVLPEGLSFDGQGRHLIATSFEGRDGSGLCLFRVERMGDDVKLVAIGRVAAPHGAHHVVLTDTWASVAPHGR